MPPAGDESIHFQRPRRPFGCGRHAGRGRPTARSFERAAIVNRGNAKDDPVLLELDRYGIETVSIKTYLWGGYRYTNARDAVAAAKRNNAI